MSTTAAAAAVFLCAQAVFATGDITAWTPPEIGSDSVGHTHGGKAVKMTLTFAYDGIRAWHPSLSGFLHNFPPHYTGKFQIATSDNYRFPGNGYVQYECPPGVTGGACDVVVFLYECYPCVSEKGGLPTYLQSNGYERSRCAPMFSVKAGGYRHRMTAFIKTIAAGEREIIAMPRQGDVEFAAFGLSNGNARPCGTYDSEAACEGHDGHCVWYPQAYKCKLATCVQKGPGGCDRDRCAKKELL